MKKVLFTYAAMAIAALVVSQAARADTIKFTVTDSGNEAVGTGSGTAIVENFVVTNTSTGTCSTGCAITIDSLAVYFGGSGGAPSTNTAPTGYTYELDTPTPLSETGDVAVHSGDGNPGDQITSATLYDASNLVGLCFVGDVLDKGQTCDIELTLGVTGVAPTTKNDASGKSYGKTLVFATVGTSTGTKSDDFKVEVDYTPEPGSLVLLGSGLGLLGLGVFLRRRHAAVQLTAV